MGPMTGSVPSNKRGFTTCLDCGKRYEFKWVKDSFDQSGRAPECVECDGYIKTATVAFVEVLAGLVSQKTFPQFIRGLIEGSAKVIAGISWGCPAGGSSAAISGIGSLGDRS